MAAVVQAPVSSTPNPTIVGLLAKVDNSDRTKIVSTVDTILDILEKENFAYRKQIHPSAIGVHPCNRNGYGISPIEVHALGETIVKLGWSWNACSHAVCIEDDAKSTIGSFTQKLSQSASGLAPKTASDIVAGSLSCSHTTAFLDAVNNAVPTTSLTLAVDDCLPRANIVDRDPKFGEALDKGLNWLVLRSSVAEMYPSLLELVQHAKNVGTEAARRESEVQLLLRIHEASKALAETSGGRVDWDRVEARLSKRESHYKNDLSAYVKFVKRWGGGSRGLFIEELRVFHQAFGSSSRIVPTTTFEKLADLKLSITELCPFFVMAVVKAQATCHPSKVSNNVCRHISGSEIATLSFARKDSI